MRSYPQPKTLNIFLLQLWHAACKAAEKDQRYPTERASNRKTGWVLADLMPHRMSAPAALRHHASATGFMPIGMAEKTIKHDACPQTLAARQLS